MYEKQGVSIQKRVDLTSTHMQIAAWKIRQQLVNFASTFAEVFN